jgi:hypothetical protein
MLNSKVINRNRSLIVMLLLLVNGLTAQNVGISTSAPDAKLHIVSNGAERGMILEDAESFPLTGLQFTKTGSSENFEINRLLYDTPESSYFDFNYNGSPKMSLRGDGNLGVGTLNPTQRLDVDGNVNMNGNLLVDNTQGNPGEVLATMPDGSTGWSDPGFGNSRFENSIVFFNDDTWTVPAGVTEIGVELWGGGGGGTGGHGGNSGNYLYAIIEVPAGDVVTITIGDGGDAVLSGENTEINTSGTFGSLFARGGLTAFANGSFNAPNGSSHGSLPYKFIKLVRGSAGTATTVEYTRYDNDVTIKTIHWGDGGKAVHMDGQYSLGGYNTTHNGSSSYNFLNRANTGSVAGPSYGGRSIPFGTTPGTGAKGGKGMAYIHW